MDTLYMTEGEVARQCSHRRQHSCGLIDVHLGWMATVPLEVCRDCISYGTSSAVSASIRSSQAASVVAGIKDRGLEHYHPLVQVSVMGKFMTAEEAEDASRRIENKARLDAVRAENSKWDGVPYHRRVGAAAVAATKAFRAKLKSYKGCGCYKPLKKLVTGK